jgi:predicted signal transduction protein with EAL and GGDEF domain
MGAKACGYRSIAALPLFSDGRVDAVIVLRAAEGDFFDSQEMQLLEEIAADISFALDYLVKQERLRHVSLHDPLTGLANREMFFDRLEQSLAAPREDRRPLAVVVIDLQRFRKINDTLGRGGAAAREGHRRHLCVLFSGDERAGVQAAAARRPLRSAVSEHAFSLAYQPKVELGARRIVGLEALIRWTDPALGSVAPNVFIPVLEETAMVVEAGRQVLEQTVADVRRWRAQGLALPRVAVNVSYVQVRQKDFVATVRSALGADASLGIDLEITECLVVEDLQAGMAKLAELRAGGMKMAGSAGPGGSHRMPERLCLIDAKAPAPPLRAVAACRRARARRVRAPLAETAANR